ncbi:GNS1/SUR4 family protein [Dictyostelium discoideum AX4]|uniref:Putative fatty acid elongase DDB_G0272012 n=1 Tax=Dictyostelium discoideum TaxID=44689 RepID=Y2012_DICDI|nr:GNS1/SUR4 family protein [Dictyostelium discoideum AX4]Q86JM5.1 RecName: Full=Putative fatty acid elongase DDB_G0272012; AltName: Full=3-keto acyl-CoA synthase DDB_G0272012; AltName: Full=Putative elongation of fatty acids protein DDB_G0272012; AltName: Full=Very-long-chain 3-oxoacyl-CoA synthase DDB_G0272012 [Dictyostelium discoideum]EAL71440.1 GNS1/SUR4 family protein [Dictyostelium discoideum AX4]|eukprot:XP_645380.1 GNS1/SUR4 family protein [Dictyostelium discoideum AX4]
METIQSVITEWSDSKSWDHLFQHNFKDSNWSELFDPVNFKFKFGTTPFSQFQILPSVISLYLVIIFSIKFLMRNRKPFSLKYVSILHNAILCIWSLVMCVGILYEVIKRITAEGPLFTVCETVSGFDKGPAYYWSYIFYISKFYELLDTVIIVLKKKPLIFLHVYHHCIVVWLCWYFMYSGWNLQLWVVFLNTFVHVFMYYFYFQTGRGKTVWWKKYITMIQIIQFICLGIAGLLHSAAINLNSSPCFTHYPAFISAYLINFSFLFLFSQFFVKSYSNKPTSSSSTTTPTKTKKID